MFIQIAQLVPVHSWMEFNLVKIKSLKPWNFINWHNKQDGDSSGMWKGANILNFTRV